MRKVPSRIFFTTSHFVTTLALLGFGIFVQHNYLTAPTTSEKSPLNETFSNHPIPSTNSIIANSSTQEILEDNSETGTNYANFVVQYFGWVPLVAIIVTVIMRSGSILPVLRVLQNELYPTEIRSQGILNFFLFPFFSRGSCLIYNFFLQTDFQDQVSLSRQSL